MKLWALLLVLYSPLAWSFPEMIRHHYVNCTACHFSPSGGGLLTPYGRTISSEVLSTWGSEKEGRSFYGALDSDSLNQWLNVGGDVRALQYHHDSSTVTEGKTIPMQAGLEFVVTVKKWSAEFFYGKLNQDWKVEPIATRYWVMYQFLDELTVRAGRFIPVFGLNIPQHTVTTRQGLGFNEGQERNSLEAMWAGEKWNFVTTASQSVEGTTDGGIEQAMSTQVNYTIGDSYKVGGSYWLGTSDSMHRQIYGVQTVLGFNEKWYMLAELDYQVKNPVQAGGSQKGIYQFAKLGYEFYKGIHAQVVQEYSQSNLDSNKSKYESLGPGFSFYPRPHFEFEFLWTKKKIYAMSDDYQDFAYLMGHYYF